MTVPCKHVPTVRVSSHDDLSAAVGAMASTYCCDRPACLHAARVWVFDMTERTATVQPLPAHPARSITQGTLLPEGWP